MQAKEIRKKYLEFMKNRGHKIVSSASLMPENDPTTLFTGSGMQPMVPYLLGEKYPGGEKRITNSQKCFRSGDIEEVGDNRHTTFFEMLGNWSLGDQPLSNGKGRAGYFKKEQIEWLFEFLTGELKLDPKRIYVSVYRGNEKFDLPKEKEAVKIWQEQFKKVDIEAETVDLIKLKKEGIDLKSVCLVDDLKLDNSNFNQTMHSPVKNSKFKIQNSNKIFYYPDSENWWSRAGAPNKMPVGEPGGPDSEVFWDFGADLKLHENSPWANQPCHPACDCGRFMEIGNSVFMQYKKTKDGFKELKQKNIDFGGGLERLTAAVLDTPDVFLTDLFELPMKKLEEVSGKKYNFTKGNLGYDEMPDCWAEDMKSMRVILDHLRAATFLINDGAEPSNKDQGYFTRRLIRRAVRFGHQLGIEKNFTKEIAQSVVKTYQDYYTDLADSAERIYRVIEEEEAKFRKTLIKGLKEFEKFFVSWIGDDGSEVDWILEDGTESKWKTTDIIPGKVAFDLFQTYGFPIEMTEEIANEKELKVDKKGFKEELQKHKDLSRTASAGKFKGGLADNDKTTTQLHTITHLMLAGLRKVLGDNINQRGSNITPERIRFDFSFDRAMTDEEKQTVEKFVNDALQTGGKVTLMEMPKQQAMDEGVIGAFWEKYPEQVKVYTITAPDGTIYSRELCGGPHIKSLDEIKGKFKILKEKSSGSGVRRIRAVVK